LVFIVEFLQNKEEGQTSPSPIRESGDDGRSSYPLLNTRIDNGQD
jgi:hypothetical protein